MFQVIQKEGKPSAIAPKERRRTGSPLVIQSYAKINLTLEVLGKRCDGYHELASIMQTIDIYDTLTLNDCDDDRIHLICTQPELNTADNLVVRAAQALRQQFHIKDGVVIELQKRIPVSAGLGGGSSNAAAILLGLQQWWHIAASPEELLTLAASLGSDVPFFLTGGLAFCQGRGEQVTPLAPSWPSVLRWFLLLKPGIGVSTAAVYRALPASDCGDGSASNAVLEALQEKKNFPFHSLQNSLERSVVACYPEVDRARRDMLEAGAPYVRLSGSGPTLFAPFSCLSEASKVEQYLFSLGYEVYLTRACYPGGTEFFSY
jgi:4-diphosphocytidyl-2-C-methyl-D-erythritol kinase